MALDAEQRKERSKELARKRAHEWYIKNKSRASKSNKKWAQKNPDIVKATIRNYEKRNPLKRKAYKRVHRALKNGVLLKQPCEVCGDCNSEAHHDDYSKPLMVRWLCRTHHKEHHRKYPHT